MSYEQYKREMDRLERLHDDALSMDDPVATTVFQKQMDNLNARMGMNSSDQHK